MSFNIDRMKVCEDEPALFKVVWECIAPRIQNGTFHKCQPVATVDMAAHSWLNGVSFGEIHAQMIAAGARIGIGRRPRLPKIDHIVELAEQALGFEAAHILNAIADLTAFFEPSETDSLVKRLYMLQRRLKYGLPAQGSVVLYEAGFSDRPLALELADVLPGLSTGSELPHALSRRRDVAEDILSRYPSYFTTVYNRLSGWPD